jgi:hypothetical protein
VDAMSDAVSAASDGFLSRDRFTIRSLHHLIA